ncbi:efflux transporter outer membrane subunit [uncultured Duncaniella sp.]|uniref:efflux transporter outer membrane subunit n=1 Tax=uncultured Duncaniella sp. TaxID=2768039 RepID=UPI0025F691BB|nr:TolC family protein [uncultured Duncaniella sp.]
MKPRLFLHIFIALIALTSCSGVKNLTQADITMPETYMPGLESDSACVADMAWWEFYADSTLCHLIRLTLDNNRDLLKSAAKVEEARHLYGIDKANFYPEINGLAGANYETNNYSGSGTTKDPEYDLKFTVSWEMNLWGSLSWAKKRGAARFQASVEDLHAMRMTLIAEVAYAYFRLIALDNELAIVRQTLATREESLEQARIRFEGGLTSETVYQQAKVEYASAAALVPNLERQVTVARNAITLLMGEYPREILERGQLALNITLPEKLPAGIPSTLLERRPDLRAAERRLAAAMADVGVNYANRFPNLRLAFTPGFENDALADFFKSPFTYSIGTITGSVFDFGRKKRKYQAAIAVYDQARYDYEKAVITAFTEVNSALETYRRVKENGKLKVELRDATVKYVQLAHLQYRAGTLNYIDVLDAQRRYFDAQIGVSNALRDEYLALINLYKVLGGGWTTEFK